MKFPRREEQGAGYTPPKPQKLLSSAMILLPKKEQIVLGIFIATDPAPIKVPEARTHRPITIHSFRNFLPS